MTHDLVIPPFEEKPVCGSITGQWGYTNEIGAFVNFHSFFLRALSVMQKLRNNIFCSTFQ